MGLGLSCFVSGSLQLYGPGSQLLYVLASAVIRSWSLKLHVYGLLYALVSAAIYTWDSAALCLGFCSYVGLGLSFLMSWPLQQYSLGLCSYLVHGSQLLYVLVSAAIYAWVSAALCLGLSSYVGLGLSCLLSWPLHQYDPGICSYI